MESQVKVQAEIRILPKDDEAMEAKEGQQRRQTPSAFQLESKQTTPICYVLKLIIVSLLIGGLIFIELHYRHDIDDWVAGISSGSVAIVISILLAYSQSARCVVFLLIPSLGTRLGKSSLVTLLTAMLLAGPAANLNYNFKQTTHSLICFGEAAFNQTSFASDRYKDSMREMSGQVGNSLAHYVEMVDAVRRTINSVDASLKKTSDSLYSTLNDLNGEMDRCRQKTTSVNGDCQREMESLKAKCIDAMKGQGLFRRKKRGWLSDISKAGENAINKVKEIGSDVADRVDKMQLTDVCDLFSSDLCNVTAEICGGIKEVGKWTFSSLAAIPENFRPLIRELQTGASYTRQLESMLNRTSSFDEVKRNVTSEIEFFLDRLLRAIGSLSSYLSLITLVVVVITSWLYHFRFRHSLLFDNIYINKDLKAYDSSRHSSLLPLRGSAEEKEVIDCLSLSLSPCEKKSLLTSLLVYCVVIILATILILVDWVLFQVTDIIRRNGRTALQVGVESQHRFRVEGVGFLSTFFRFLFKEFDYQSNVMNQIDTIPCLPKPLQLSLEHLIRPAIVVIALGLVTFLQPYCLRSRHAIAAFFYPERQQERVAYLYNEMLRLREASKASMQHRIPGRLDENRKVDETISGGSRLVKTLNWLGFLRRSCLLCGCQGSNNGILKSFSSAEKYIICNRSSDCPAFYCASCWNHLENCAVCGKIGER